MLVTFCVIAYNEENSIGCLLEDLCLQTYQHKYIEVLFIDGMSNDKTKSIMLDFKEKHEGEFYKILVLDNSGKILSSGWNVALANYSGEAIVRVDAHAKIPHTFIENNVHVLLSGHDICGGKVTSYIVQKTKWSQVINAAENSMFGGSIATFRRANKTMIVDTLAFGMYKKEVFDNVGLFNENLVRTEDNDIHYRMRKVGYKLLYSPDIESFRETRSSFRKLLKQKYLNGYWIGLTLGVSPKCFSLYHFIPLVFVLSIMFTTILLFVGLWQFAALLWGLYFLLNLAMTIISIHQEQLYAIYMLVMSACFILLHISYGIGTFAGLLYMPLWKLKLTKRMHKKKYSFSRERN